MLPLLCDGPSICLNLCPVLFAQSQPSLCKIWRSEIIRKHDAHSRWCWSEFRAFLLVSGFLLLSKGRKVQAFLTQAGFLRWLRRHAEHIQTTTKNGSHVSLWILDSYVCSRRCKYYVRAYVLCHAAHCNPWCNTQLRGFSHGSLVTKISIYDLH